MEARPVNKDSILATSYCGNNSNNHIQLQHYVYTTNNNDSNNTTIHNTINFHRQQQQQRSRGAVDTAVADERRYAIMLCYYDTLIPLLAFACRILALMRASCSYGRSTTPYSSVSADDDPLCDTFYTTNTQQNTQQKTQQNTTKHSKHSKTKQNTAKHSRSKGSGYAVSTYDMTMLPSTT